jgi:hypothetical protein
MKKLLLLTLAAIAAFSAQSAKASPFLFLTAGGYVVYDIIHNLEQDRNLKGLNGQVAQNTADIDHVGNYVASKPWDASAAVPAKPSRPNWRERLTPIGTIERVAY